MYRYKAWSAKVLPCLNSKDGAHRLSFGDPEDGDGDGGGGHEMVESEAISLSFPTSVFSVTNDDDEENAILMTNPSSNH